jgi:hypothetical protein
MTEEEFIELNKEFYEQYPISQYVRLDGNLVSELLNFYRDKYFV